MYVSFPKAGWKNGLEIKNAIRLRYIAQTRIRMHFHFADSELGEVTALPGEGNWDIAVIGPESGCLERRKIIDEMRQEFFLGPTVRRPMPG